MKASPRKVAIVALGLAALFGILALLYSFQVLTADTVLRSALRQVIAGAEKKEAVERLREVAAQGLESADRIACANSAQAWWGSHFFWVGVAVETLALFLIAVRKEWANQPLHGTPAKAPSSSTEPERWRL